MSNGETPLRAVRIDDVLWGKAKAQAARKGDNLSDIIRQALRDYVNNHIEQGERNGDQ